MWVLVKPIIYLISKKKSGAFGERVVIDGQGIISDLNAAYITISVLKPIDINQDEDEDSVRHIPKNRERKKEEEEEDQS